MAIGTEADKKLELTGLRKCSIAMVVLGEEASAEILKHLEEEEVYIIGREIACMPVVTSEVAEGVLEQLQQMSLAHDYVLKGGIDYARKILTNAFGPDRAQGMLDRLTKALGNDSANFDELQKADPQLLAQFLHNEHPQTIALILSHLNPSQAAALLTSLPAEIRSDVALRMGSLCR